jgi:NADPH2:quinone reductase
VLNAQRGLYQHRPELPYVPGAEIAGVVRSAPAGAHVAAGDRVAALTLLTGAMAEVVALPADRIFKLPDAVSFEAGAGLLFNDLTVHCALRTRGRLARAIGVGARCGRGYRHVTAPGDGMGAARTIACQPRTRPTSRGRRVPPTSCWRTGSRMPSRS